MKAHLRHVTALLLVICCLLSVVGCQRGAGEEPYEAEITTSFILESPSAIRSFN